MKRSHALTISLLLAVAVVAGGFAAVKTAALGGQSGGTVAADAAVATKTAQLDRFERKLKTALAQKPPKLPSLEKHSTTASSGARVVYVQAPAAASSTPPSGGAEAEDEHEDGGEHGDSEGGGLDD